MRICIHRGAHQIGGSCVELEAQGQRLLLDLGMPLDAEENLPELLPSVQGLREASDNLLGVLLSHPHLDHHGLLKHTRPELKVAMGAAGRRILEAAEPWVPDSVVPAPGPVLKDRQHFAWGPFQITPYLVDHSAFDSYAFLIEADGRRVFYSGDFRAHGRKSKLFDRMIAHPPKNLDVLFLEGSSLGRLDMGTTFETETELEQRLVGEFEATEGLALFHASPQNIDRMVTLLRAAKRSGRRLVIDLYAAAVLEATGTRSIPQSDWPEVALYVPFHQRLQIKLGQRFKLLNRHDSHRIKDTELAADPTRSVLLFRGLHMRDLEKAGALRGARLFYSMWEGYLKKESGARMLRWAEKHRIPFVQAHTSGHAGPADLRRFAEALVPKVVVPIHSFHPDSYSELFPRIEAHEDGVWWELPPAPEVPTTTPLTSEGPLVPASSPPAEEPDPWTEAIREWLAGLDRDLFWKGMAKEDPLHAFFEEDPVRAQAALMALKEYCLPSFALVECDGLASLPEGFNPSWCDLSYCPGLKALPDGFNPSERCRLSGCVGLTSLPAGFNPKVCDLTGCNGLTSLPDGFNPKKCDLSGCTGLTALPEGFNPEECDLSGCTGLTSLPHGFNPKECLLIDCTGLVSLPAGFNPEECDLAGCAGLNSVPDGFSPKECFKIDGRSGLTFLPPGFNPERCYFPGWIALTSLPDGFNPKECRLEGCTGLTSLPEGFASERRCNLSGCAGLTSLPEAFSPEECWLIGCVGLTSLPEGFNPEWCDLEDCTGLTSLPDGFSPKKKCDLQGCTGLTSLPDGFNPEVCNLGLCTGLKRLPDGFNPKECYLDDSGIEDLPESMTGSVWLCRGGFMGDPADEVREWLRSNKIILDSYMETFKTEGDSTASD